jgi:hypothetical protein
MKHRVGVTITILHICAFLNLLLAIGCAWLAISETGVSPGLRPGKLWFVTVLCATFAIGQEITVWGLKRRQFWAWVSGICLSALIVPTILLPLGGLGLWGLLAAGSRREFGMSMSPAVVGVAIVMCLQSPGFVTAKTISIPDTGITFEAPNDFTTLTTDEIAMRYPRSRPPKFALGNEQRTTAIAYDLTSTPLSLEKLPEIKPFLESFFEKNFAGIAWIKKEIVSIQGQPWIYLESTHTEEDDEFHNIILITSLRGKMLRASFSSTTEEFPKVEQTLRNSIQSIVLRPA